MKNLTLIALMLIASFVACRKDDTNKIKKFSVTEFNNKFAVPIQKFNQVAGTAFSITGTKGIKLDFPANAFLDAAGNPVTGNINLSLIEILSKKDILLSGKMTESNGQIIISGGEFQILALQNGQLLKLNPSAYVVTKVPTTLNTDPMDIFEFKAIVPGDSTWMLNQNPHVLSTTNYYQFSLPSFGWVNCDYFYSNPNPKTTITASPTYSGAVPSIKEQRAYLVFDNLKSVVGLPFQLSLNKHQSYLNSMPIGLSGKMIIISVAMDDTIYFGATNFTISNALHVNIPMTIGDQTTIDNYLNSL